MKKAINIPTPRPIEEIRRHGFLFSELVKRDFKKKYKRTYLGMLWSVLSPLLTLFIMRVIFTSFFGNEIEHFTVYLFCGNIVFSFFSDATGQGMGALMDNADIFTKINIPKYLFLLSKIVCALINFALTLLVFLVFCVIDGVMITPLFLTLVYPIFCLIIFNTGLSLILSAMFVFFRDIQYLWGIFLTLLTYLSAIFYDPAQFGAGERLFLFNPIYVYIKYFRLVTIGAGGAPPSPPSGEYHGLMLLYALAALGIGILIYKKNDHRFLYYV
ncbi:MAG: ABC transporter permease [Clostridia bacterium]|nr:ABC transporter permease [Clostridia bacterium]